MTGGTAIIMQPNAATYESNWAWTADLLDSTRWKYTYRFGKSNTRLVGWGRELFDVRRAKEEMFTCHGIPPKMRRSP